MHFFAQKEDTSGLRHLFFFGIIHVQLARQASFFQGPGQAVLKALHGLAQVELGVRDQPGVIVDAGEQVAFTQLALV